MLKKIISLALGLFIFTNSLSFAFAASPSPSTSPSPAPTMEKIDTFAMFWPLTAGKTIESKLYFLKTLKESLRGLLIFGKPQKANYQVFLGTKRVLEANYLISQNKKDFAKATFDKAKDQFDKAVGNLQNQEIPVNVKAESGDRVNNLKKLLKYIQNTNPEFKAQIDGLLDSLNKISSKI